MKAYAILDKEADSTEYRKTRGTAEKTADSIEPIGYLFCYEKPESCIIELREGLDEWEAPLLFQSFVRNKVYTIPGDAARLWVEERVIPSDRQNIGTILREAKMQEYNVMALLARTKGKCSQDSCYLKEIKYEEIPEKIRRRSDKNVTECFQTDEKHIVCLFRDNAVRKISLEKLEERFWEIRYVLKNKELLKHVSVGVGGYSIIFNGSIEIPASALRDKKYAAPLLAEDFRYYVRNGIVDTTKACELLQCSRQNLSYLVNAGKLEPLRNTEKENLFARGEIDRILNG